MARFPIYARRWFSRSEERAVSVVPWPIRIMLLATVLMQIVSVPIRFDWGAIAILVGVGAGVIAAVTALTLPLLWRQMRPEALRTE